MTRAVRWFMCVAACMLIVGGAIADESHSILGTVTTDTGKPLPGVRVDFGEKLAAVLTDDAGYYEAEGAVEGGVYLVEPVAAGWTFAPVKRAVVMGSGDEMVNFSAQPVGGALAGALFAPPTAASAQAKVPHEYPVVDSPVAGDIWKQGRSYNIRWTYTPSSLSMRIRLRRSGTADLNITCTTANDGSFWWKVPASVTPATDYTIMVDDGFYGSGSGKFTIAAAPLVTYPSEKNIAWRRGQGYQIKWQGFPGANVKIQLYRGSLLSRGIAWSTPNDGSFWWSVPLDQRTADNYKIKVTAHSNSVNDMSDRPFTIVNNPRVTYPTYAGVVWDIGGSYNITWRQFVCDQVKIDLLACGTLQQVITASTANDGSFHWQVPYDQPPGGGFQVRVRAVGCAAQSDKSNVGFQIRRVPAVTHPTASGITWGMGSPHTIQWHGFTSANVKIELLRGWTLDRVISNWTPNDGAFKWWVPVGQAASTTYRIRISGRPANGQQDVSDSNFSIVAVPMVTYPSASGIEWDHGQYVTITWQGITGPTVGIKLSQWGVTNSLLTMGTPNDGLYQWRVLPGSMASGNGFKIRVAGQMASDGSDESNQNFRINSKPIVLSPNGGSTESGMTEIRWNGFDGALVTLELWSGSSFASSLGTTANDGTANVNLSGEPDGDEYRFRVISVTGPFESDFSDSVLSIDNS